MTRLRETVKKKVYTLLEASHFTSCSYSVEFIEESPIFLRIAFLPNENFIFQASSNYSDLETKEAPGLHKYTTETFKQASIDGCLDAIEPWTVRILEDYLAQKPVVDEFESLRNSIQERINLSTTDEAAHFSIDEVSDMRAELDELFTKLSGLTEKTAEQEKRLRDAEKEIKILKQELEFLPKGVWYRMASSKVIDILKKVAASKEGRDFALEAAKKLLLGSTK
jgi:hypothetical protein